MPAKKSGAKAPVPGFVLNLLKRRSETPLQTVERYAAAHPELTGAKMTYAGRLDPMAEGVLVVLGGEKNKEREAYTGLDKDYEFEFVLGVETDTNDLLGRITDRKGGADVVSRGAVEAALKKYVGTFEQPYPAYSSKVVGGVPLFEYARLGKPVAEQKHVVTVTSLELLSERRVPRAEFFAMVRRDVGAVKGDFRQGPTVEIWNEYEKEAPESLVVYKARVSCGSGFYVRQLVSDVGRDLGTGAVTVTIKRTRVGEFKIEDSIA